MTEALPIAPWIAAALALHALVVVAAPPAADAPPPPPPPVEIELPPPPEPPPAPEPPPPPAPDPSPAPARAPTPAAAKAVAPVARAAPLLTAAPSPDPSPVAFVTDPDGTTFGYGVVARGGTAEQGTAVPAAPSSAPVARPAPPPAETSTPPEDWTRPPRLDETDPCSGFFPRHAAADAGRVALVVVIEPGGRVASTSVSEESPPGDGFGEAARACLKTKVFSPALGLDGKPTRATATVRIRFSR